MDALLERPEDLAARHGAATAGDAGRPGAAAGFAFDYDAETVAELDAAAGGGERS